jgi:hypothetical protein
MAVHRNAPDPLVTSFFLVFVFLCDLCVLCGK